MSMNECGFVTEGLCGIFLDVVPYVHELMN